MRDKQKGASAAVAQRDPHYVVARPFTVGDQTYYPGTRVGQSNLVRLPSWRLEELERNGLVRSA